MSNLFQSLPYLSFLLLQLTAVSPLSTDGFPSGHHIGTYKRDLQNVSTPVGTVPVQGTMDRENGISGISTMQTSTSSRAKAEEIGNSTTFLDAYGSPTEWTTSQGQTMYATPADRNTLLSFLGRAYSYGAKQYRAGQQGQENNTYFKYGNGNLSLTITVFDSSLFPDRPMGWDTFANIALAYSEYTKDKLPDQASTWVGTIRATNTTVDKATMIVTNNFIDVERPANLVFSTSDPTTATDDTDSDTSSSDDLGRRHLPQSDNRPGILPTLNKRRSDLKIGRSGWTLSAYQYPEIQVLASTVVDLAKIAYSMFWSDTTARALEYSQFTIPLDYPGQSIQGAYKDLVFQFEAAGRQVIPRAIMLEFVQTVLRLTKRYHPGQGKIPIVHGALYDKYHHKMGTWSLGSTLSAVGTKFVSVAGCLVENPDGSIVACIIRDEL